MQARINFCAVKMLEGERLVLVVRGWARVGGHFGIFVDCGAEFLLDVADAVVVVSFV